MIPGGEEAQARLRKALATATDVLARLRDHDVSLYMLDLGGDRLRRPLEVVRAYVRRRAR